MDISEKCSPLKKGLIDRRKSDQLLEMVREVENVNSVARFPLHRIYANIWLFVIDRRETFLDGKFYVSLLVKILQTSKW